MRKWGNVYDTRSAARKHNVPESTARGFLGKKSLINFLENITD